MKNIIFAMMLSFCTPVFGACSAPGQAIQKFDTLVERDETCNEKWANIEATVQRRYDLIPNLVEIVKASAKFEQKTLTDLEQARAAAKSITLQGSDFYDENKLQQWQSAQNNLRNSIMVVREAYPDLKTSKQFTDLMTQMEGSENRILRAREEYNKAVREYNTELRNVGGRAVNNLTGQEFKPRVFFVADPEAKKAPKVDFSDK